jgi:hypothetical protein
MAAIQKGAQVKREKAPVLNMHNVHAGMRVVTPSGEIACVLTAPSIDPEDLFYRVTIIYLTPGLGKVRMQPKLLREYEGKPVVFAHEQQQRSEVYAALARKVERHWLS